MTLKSEAARLATMAFQELHSPKDFIAGESPIPVTGKSFDSEEIGAAIEASLEFWLTAGYRSEQFERQIANFLGMRHAFMVNSGSSANLLALSSLKSKILGSDCLKDGDEVITVAAGFPTTVTPILQNNLIPVYVDVSIGTYTVKIDDLHKALSPKTRAIMMAHTLGNPFDIENVMKFAKEHSLWVIEDNCDALGGTYNQQKLGSFGDLSTLSFYPAHHITTGEGGAVAAKSVRLKRIIESLRDWGRDCWCPPGCDNTCKKRFDWNLGQLPNGFDHKYIYSHLGYNLKSGDIQAAIGSVQLEKLPDFVDLRKRNWNHLVHGLSDLEDLLVLPSATPNSDPSWFGFALTIRSSHTNKRNELVRFLNTRQIGTRLLFGGNLLKQPAFLGTPRVVIGELENTNKVMEDTFWVGVWPGLSLRMLDYVIESIHEFFKK